MDAFEQGETGSTPRFHAAIQHGEIRVAEAPKNPGRPLGQPVAAIAQHDGRAPPRHQAGHVDLQAAQRRVAGEQDVGARERPLLAHIEQREFGVTVSEPRPQRGRRDPRAHLWMLGEAG